MKKININNAQDYIDWLKSGKKFVAEAPRLFDELLPELTRYLNDRLPEAINTIQRRNPSNLKRLLKRIAEYAQPDEMYQLMINSETLTTDRTFSSKYDQLLFYYGREHARIYTDKYSETLSTAQKKRNANPETKSLLPTQKEFWMRKGFSEEEAIQKVNDTQEKAQARAMAVYHEHRRDWHNVDFWTEKGYSLEDAKAEVEQRMNRCRDYSVHTLAEYAARMKRVKNKKTGERPIGKLMIKQYPTGGANSNHFEALMNELRLKKQFKPDVVIVDYLGICASSRLRVYSENSYTLVKAIAEELRGFFVKWDVIGWTAAQTTRAGWDASDLNMSDTAECLDATTTVETVNGIKLLKDVKVGELVKSYDGYRPVIQVHHPKPGKRYKIKLASGKEIICSETHRFPTQKGRINLREGLTVGDKLNTM